MKTWTGVCASLLLSLLAAPIAGALSVVDTEPFPESSPLVITAYSVTAAQSSLDFVQLYNNEDTPLALDGWGVAYTTTTSTAKVPFATLAGYMTPKSHYVLAVSGGLSGPGVLSYDALDLPVGAKLKSLALIPPVATITSAEQSIAGDGMYRRNLTTTGYSTSTTFAKQDPLTFTALAADPLYVIPPAPQLKIVEIVPRSADCAPNDASLVCGDYVKLHNTSAAPYDASAYRVRTDSSTSESSNAFALPWLIEPGAYLTVHLKNDGDKLSLTDGGGYVWLEDAFGLVKFYDETMVNYPSASSQSKQGWAWALAEDGVWQWTSTPQPNIANLITLPIPTVAPVAVATEPSECPAGKYRNPETNRCKNIEEAIATIAACDEDQERNPLTNRCRKIAVATVAALTPCEPGEERNPATNRCRAVLSATTSTDKPCPEGQERNPATNRCRTVVSSAAPPALQEVAGKASESGVSPYWVGAAVLAGAAGYGMYEWRSEIWKVLRRIIPKLGSK